MAYQHIHYKNANSNNNDALEDFQISLDCNVVRCNTVNADAFDILDALVLSAEGSEEVHVGVILKKTHIQPFSDKCHNTFIVEWVHTNVHLPQDDIKKLCTSSYGIQECVITTKRKLITLGVYVRNALAQ